MENKASQTALLSAFCRAFHAEHEKQPVFTDFMAKKLLTDEEYEQIKHYILQGASFFEPDRTFSSETECLRHLINTHLAPTPLCRAAYCETALAAAVFTGTVQYVILGAGLDTFILRHPEFCEKHKIFEADHPLTQKDKQMRIARAELTVPKNAYFVPVDFSKDNLEECLLKSGFDPHKKSFFSLLGVSYYLTRPKIENLLSSLSRLMAEGSTLLFDVPDENLFLSKERRVQNMLAMAKASGEEMKSCFDYFTLEKLLSDYGFLIYEYLTPKDIQSRIIKGADMKAFEHICYVQAVFKA